MKVLVIAPFHDYATYLSIQAVNRLKKWMDKKGINYYAPNPLLTSRHFISLYAKEEYDLVCYYGHGLSDRLGGGFIHFYPIFDINNISLFEDSIIYTMSCLSARKLGREAVKRGVKTYFGQKVKYFTFLPDHQYDYMEDWYWLVNTIPKALMKGKNAAKAMDIYENRANNLHIKYSAHDIRNANILFSNALNMIVLGNKMAQIKNL